jgi:formate dehydrogenase major subunit
MLPIHAHDTDHGTPRRDSDTTVTLQIDGHAVSVPAGTSLMRAAVEAGIRVPKLCATDSVEAFGSCRLCLVEVEGRRGYPASCTTPAEPGMVVRTQTPKLAELRRGVMELYISDHPLDCLTCSANGNCELQDMAGAVGLRAVRYGVGEAAGAHHTQAAKDESNPYFTYDPSKCIVCSRCVRACEEVQGTFALTISGRGFDSRVSPGQDEAFMASECVSCGACVEACPTATLQEKSVIWLGQAEHAVTTTCAYCGVGCGFKAEMKGSTVVRMVPWKDGKANEGHACVKGRFAWGYATHPDRLKTPKIRERITDPWREVSWDEAIGFAAARFKAIQAEHGRDAVGGITSSRCTNEETYLVQKLVRAAFGTNNVDTCARVCHSPTGYGLGQTYGTSAGTQDFASVAHADVVLVIGANPTDAHPVFASRMKRRLRQGARLIVIDPRRIELVRTPHVAAEHHLQLRPGTNVAVLNALAHVVVTEGLVNEAFVAERCERTSFEAWRSFVARPEHAPEAVQATTGVPAAELRAAARLYAAGPNSALYYGLGVTEHSQGSTAVIAIANLAMACGMVGREGVGVNPLRGQGNVQGGSCLGSWPHMLTGYRFVTDDAVRGSFEDEWKITLDSEPGLRLPNMFDAAVTGSFKAIYIQGEDPVQSDPNRHHVEAALRSMECVVVQDLYLSETAKLAHVFFPGSSSLEKDGTFTNAERRVSMVRKVVEPLGGLADWQITVGFMNAMGYECHYDHPSEVLDEIARTSPAYSGMSFDKIEKLGSVQWPCNTDAPEGTEVLHTVAFPRGKGSFMLTGYLPTQERATDQYPLLLTTGRILSQYNVGTQTRRTANVVWHDDDLLEISADDAAARGLANGDRARISSRYGATELTVQISERVNPGIVYTTFHFAHTMVNNLTSDLDDWATNCPEYKVTAVDVERVAVPQPVAGE